MTKLVVRTDGILEIAQEDVDALSERGLRFREARCTTEDEVIEQAAGAAGLLVLAEPITARVLDALPALEAVARFGVGVDTIDVDAATERGVRVLNVPDSNSGDVALHAVAMITGLVRRLPQLNAAVRAGRWSFRDGGGSLHRATHTTIGVVGFGRIGRLVAAHCAALGFVVVVHDPLADPAAIEGAGHRAVDTLGELLTASDVVTVHVPLTAQTRNLIGADQIALMRPDAILVNVSRGGLVDENALAHAVASGALSGAGLDATTVEPLPSDSPLRDLPGVIITPHAGHFSQETLRDTIHRAFLDVARVLTGAPPRNPVN